MLQNPCKTLGFMKNMVYKIPPGGGGEVNHIQPVAYIQLGAKSKKCCPTKRSAHHIHFDMTIHDIF